MSALCIEFLSRLLGVIQNVNRSWQERCFFLHSQKINPPGIYEGNSPEIFDAVTFSKVCEQAALDLRHARHRTQEISFGLNVIFV